MRAAGWAGREGVGCVGAEKEREGEREREIERGRPVWGLALLA